MWIAHRVVRPSARNLQFFQRTAIIRKSVMLLRCINKEGKRKMTAGWRVRQVPFLLNALFFRFALTAFLVLHGERTS
jgi:hypothetical protein